MSKWKRSSSIAEIKRLSFNLTNRFCDWFHLHWFVYHRKSFLLYFFLVYSISKYSGYIVIVTTFALLKFSISYKPTCSFKLLFCTPNFSQRSSDKSSLSKIFDLINMSKITSLAFSSSIEHESLQQKTKKYWSTACVC